MGIKELGSFLQQHCSEAIYDLKLKDKSGCRCAIDVSLFMYRFKYSCGENFLSKFIEQINRLKLNNITPIYVFDGTPPKEKIDTINERKDKKNDYKEQIKQLKEQKENNDISEEEKNVINTKIDKINKKLIYVTKENINQLKYLLEMLNIKYIHKETEADLINSKLCEEGYVDMVISEDMDHLTSGTKLLLRDFNINNNVVKCYDLKKILECLELTHEKWIDLCILFGCDYLKRIRGMGTNTSYKFIKNNIDKPIEELLCIIQETKKCTIPDNYIDEFKKARNIFLNKDTLLTSDDIDFNNLPFENQISNAENYLKTYTNLSEKKIKNRLQNIFK
jgi:flap endonuclease-1